MRARTRPHRRRRAGLGWCTGSVARAPCRGGGRRDPRRRRSTCSQLSRMSRASVPLNRSYRAASPPVTSNAAITVSMTSSAVVAVSSLANQVPPGVVEVARRSRSQPPSCRRRRARRCRPAACADSRSDRAASSVSRPTSSADIDGRLPTAPCPSSATIVWPGIERRVVDQDLLLEVLQLRPGVEAELVGQTVVEPAGTSANASACRPALVQRGDQQHPQRSPGTGRTATAASNSPITSPGVTQAADRAENPVSMSFIRASSSRARCGVTQSPSPAPARTSPRNIGNVDAHRSAAPRSSPASSSADGETRVAQHGERVDSGRVDGERVSAVAADEQGWVTERPAQLGDLRLEGVPARTDGIAAPQVVDEPVGAHQDTGVEREAHQQLGGLPSRNRHELARASDLDRAEHRDREHGASLRPASDRAFATRTSDDRVGGDPGDDQAVGVVDQVVAGQGVDELAARQPRWARAIATTCRSRLVDAAARARSSRPGCRSSSGGHAITHRVDSTVSAWAAIQEIASTSPPIAWRITVSTPSSVMRPACTRALTLR